mmetsp:Transcript_71246/g.134232  ORF Transcript_71246/g.134232 Transcript_71246/m.134232 type:complete len:507 (+) Transcript_71246:201-1721(+)
MPVGNDPHSTLYTSVETEVETPYWMGAPDSECTTAPTSTPAASCWDLKATLMGKNASLSRCCTLNSRLAVLLEPSIISISHTSSSVLWLWRCVPEPQSTTWGAAEVPSGIVMSTLWSSMPGFSHVYSTFTFMSAPSGSGQQLMEMGTWSSEVVDMDHRRIPTALPLGNPLAASLSESCPFCSYSFLSTFGCVWNANPALLEPPSCTLQHKAASWLAVSCIVPFTSRLSSAPSRFKDADTFSSSTIDTGSSAACGTGAASPAASEAPPPPPAGAMGARGAKLSSETSLSIIDCFFPLPSPSCMPFLGTTGASGVGEGAPYELTDGGARSSLSNPDPAPTPTSPAIMPVPPPHPLLLLPPQPLPSLPPPPPPPPSMPAMPLTVELSPAILAARFSSRKTLALRSASSFACVSLDCWIILCSFSSCDSMRRLVLICAMEMDSRCPPVVITSSNANTRSNILALMASSSMPPAISGTSLDRRRRVSRSSTMFDALLVTRRRKRPSIGWDT